MTAAVIAGVDITGSCVIAGEPVDGTSGADHDVLDPATGELLAVLPLAGGQDVDTAVAAAKSAFRHWSRVPPPSGRPH